jgi:hypothetical protein
MFDGVGIWLISAHCCETPAAATCGAHGLVVLTQECSVRKVGEKASSHTTMEDGMLHQNKTGRLAAAPTRAG